MGEARGAFGPAAPDPDEGLDWAFAADVAGGGLAGGLDEVDDARGDEALPVVVERAIASPFDYARQTLLAVATDLPDPNAPDGAFEAATARVLADFAALTGGGLFALFTSYRALRRVAEHLRAAGFAHPLLVHGEDDRHRLLDRFRAAGDAVLLGTQSFWEGVDVPGDPLRGLLIQRLPFRVPTEPVTAARVEAIEARGGDAFRDYMLPLAALRLKQGFGRLIRSSSDRGAVLVLDDRLVRRRYGAYLRASLPPATLRRGPWDELRMHLRAFYAAGQGGAGSPFSGEALD
ncbi:MAG: ATP-dependent DNA helicase [Gemmatimonadetes bacterium]|nr:MAG: ATP-dependent DNA helicase [Gemmatimonadota bacterium]